MPRPADFKLERYFARWEFSAPHLISASDCEPLTVAELLELAGAPPEVLLGLRLGYRDSQGSPELRARIAGLYPGLDADDILVLGAPAEGIFLLCQALLRPRDRVVVQTPCYQSLRELPRSLGCEVAEWPLIDGEHGWEADIGMLAAELVPGTRLLIMNSPHNPTGWHATQGEMEAISRLCAARRVRLFCDEMYRGLERSWGERLLPAASRNDAFISLWGVSKSFGLAGLRVGWLALRDRALLDAMVRLKDYTTICASAPGELLAGLAIGVAEELFARNRRIIDENLPLARAYPGWSWREPTAGSVAFPHKPGAEAWAERAAGHRGVVVVPSTIFDFGDEHVRIGLGRHGFAEGLAALG